MCNMYIYCIYIFCAHSILGTSIFTYPYHKNQPNVGKYTSPMHPMGNVNMSVQALKQILMRK